MSYIDNGYNNLLNKVEEEKESFISEYDNEKDSLTSSSSASSDSTSDSTDPTDDEESTTSVSKLISGVFEAAEFIIANNGRIRSGQTAYDTGSGWWLGDVNGVKKLSIGSSTGNKLTWDGTNLSITGTLIATAGQFGSATNYWSIGSTGLTAVATNGDVVIKYGKTDFGQDSTNGFILGYDYSASKPKFEIGSSASKILKYDGTNFTLIGGTITGGTLQTATSGARSVITGNNVYLYDDTTGGTTPVTGDVSSLYFPRTDAAAGTFVIQKRKSTISNSGNSAEMFFSSKHSSARNYLFLGMAGDALTPAARYTHVVRMHAKELIQISSDSSDSRTLHNSEITVWTPSYSSFNAGGSRLSLVAIDCDTPAGWNSNGAFVGLGIHKDVGPDYSLIIDTYGGWFGNNFLPVTDSTYDLGSTSNRFANFWVDAITTYSIQAAVSTVTGYMVGDGTKLAIATNLAPYTDGGSYLGTSTLGWARLYLGTAGRYLYDNAGVLTWNGTALGAGIPSGGATDQFLKYDSNGVATWAYLSGTNCGSLVPSSSTANLGSSTYYWDNIYGGKLNLEPLTSNPSAAGDIVNYASGTTDQFRGRPGDGTWVGSFDMTAY